MKKLRENTAKLFRVTGSVIKTSFYLSATAAIVGTAYMAYKLRKSGFEPIRENVILKIDLRQIPRNEVEPSRAKLLLKTLLFMRSKDYSVFQRGLTFHDYIFAIKDAIKDPKVVGIIADVDGSELGLAQTNELRDVIILFNKKKQMTFAYTTHCFGKEYLLGSGFCKFYIHPLGVFWWKPYHQYMFVKNLLDKWGIKMHKFAKSEYKTFGDQFVKTELDPQTKNYLHNFYQNIFDVSFKKIYATRRSKFCKKLKVNNAKEILSKTIVNGPYNADEAMEYGMFDGKAIPIQVEQIAQEWLRMQDLRLISLGEYAARNKILRAKKSLKKLSKKDDDDEEKVLQVAFVAIQTDMINHETEDLYCELLKNIMANKSINSVVLRIDSPGGDPASANTLYQYVNELKKSGKKVIASFGNVAASGGYYVGMGADAIVADPLTITGSIGVVSVRPELSAKLLDLIGLTTDVITLDNAPKANIFNITEPLSEIERKKLEIHIEHLYKNFVSEAAKSRKKSYEDMEKLAGGKVYTGMQAKQCGLVDAHGGVLKAIELATETETGPQPYEIRVYHPITKWEKAVRQRLMMWKLMNLFLGEKF